MPTLGTILILYSNSIFSMIHQGTKNIIIGIIFIGTFLLPLSFVPLYKYYNLVFDINMKNRKDRIFPYLITLIMYLLTLFVTYRIPIKIVQLFILSVVIALSLNIILLFFWKISSHMIGIGGIIGLLAILILKYHINYLYVFIVFIVIAGILASARLFLQIHKPSEVYCGFFLGFLVVFILL